MTFGAMYGFGGVAGHFGNSSSSSFTVNYEFGSGGVGAAYTMAKSPTIDNGNDGIRNIGVGGKVSGGAGSIVGAGDDLSQYGNRSADRCRRRDCELRHSRRSGISPRPIPI